MRITHDLRRVGEAESAVRGTTLRWVAPNERSTYSAGVVAANGYEASMVSRPPNPHLAANGHVPLGPNGVTPLFAAASWESRISVY
jgi:hypothetical protein